MACGVLGGELPFAVLEIGRLHQDPRAGRPGPLALGARVIRAHHHRVGDLTAAGRSAITPHVADDHRTVAEPELGAVVLADPHPLDEAERRRQPGHGLADIGVDQDGDDSGGRDGAAVAVTPNLAATYVASSSLVGRHPS